MENTEHTKYTRLMSIILAAILLIASIIGYFVSQKLNKGGAATNQAPSTSLRTSPLPTPSLIPYPVKGAFTLKEQSGQSTFSVGKPITIDLFATSSKDTVAGYDVILSYDKTAFDRQLVQNKADTFRIFTYERGDHLSISATKNLSVTEPVRFTQTPILSFTFMPKKKGVFSFSLKSVGNESSKLVNEAAAVTYPETNDIRLEIK